MPILESKPTEITGARSFTCENFDQFDVWFRPEIVQKLSSSNFFDNLILISSSTQADSWAERYNENFHIWLHYPTCTLQTQTNAQVLFFQIRNIWHSL